AQPVARRPCARRDAIALRGGLAYIENGRVVGHRVPPFTSIMPVRGNRSAKPSDGSRPTRRRQAMMRATERTVTEMLHARAAPIKPNKDPNTAIRRKRRTSADARMRG